MIKALIIALILFSGIYADSLKVYTSAFGTYGAFSDGTNSKDGSTYLTLGYKYKHFVTLGYDYLYKDGTIWTYKQQFGSFGTSLNFDPLYLKASYGYIQGRYDDTTKYYSYDYSNLYSAEMLYRVGSVYAGAGINHYYLNGFEKRNVNAYTLRFDYYGGYRYYISIRPVYTVLTTDNPIGIKGASRNLFAVGVKLNFMLSSDVVAKAGGSFGNRVYYYDNDLYTIFNQDETQEMMLTAGIDYYPSWDVLVNFTFQHNKFDGYYANYFIAGVKINW